MHAVIIYNKESYRVVLFHFMGAFPCGVCGIQISAAAAKARAVPMAVAAGGSS